ncbi:MAG: multidrug transporter substrate-binding protein [Candidatus Eremiobacteraeota bacterium]|jgi:putative ABC transport system permease protein|nr:multidrug transporter substrate-binding protein [Candidatus Eremiobacteraeota bacterium]
MISMMQTLRLALQALVRNRSRSLLTMLGVVIGVAAVIVTVAIGTGAKTSVADQINGLGSNLVIVIPGSVQTNGARTGNGGASTLTVADGLAIAKLPGVGAVSPAVNIRTQLIANGQNWQTTVTGVAPTYTNVRSWGVTSGRFFTQSETDQAGKVAVLGQTVTRQLFPDGSDPVGRTVFVKNVPFTVIGTLAAKGQSGTGQDQDDTVLIPYTSALERLTGGTTIGSLMVSATDAAHIAPVQTEITGLLEQRHMIAAGHPDDFSVRNLQDIAAAASSTASILALLLAAVAGVSLIVGGIGIMNIMLVSVTERTREIGLRVALGARGAAILRQFLIEAVVLSTGGGAIGVVLGVAGATAIALFAKWPASVPPASIALALAFSAAVGVFFGYWPARKAAALDPIRALRFE